MKTHLALALFSFSFAALGSTAHADQVTFYTNDGSIAVATLAATPSLAARDAASGLPTGQRMHTAFLLEQRSGASPQLVPGDELPTVVVEFTRTNPNGEEVVTGTATLSEAKVVAADPVASHELTRIEFSYQKIELR